MMSCKLNLDEKKNLISSTWQWLHMSHASIRMAPWDWGTGVMGTTGACVCVCVCGRAGVRIEVMDGLKPAGLRAYEDTL